jgi:hypothetical protein
MGRPVVRSAGCGIVLTLALAAGASRAGASVTIGQVAPASPSSTCSNVVDDWVQPTEVSGNSYVVPATGGVASWTIISWSTQASATAGQHYTMKVFRKVSGLNYMVVGHDGPRALTGGALNTFPTNIVAKPGDLLGMNDNSVSPPVSTACVFAAPAGDIVFFGSGNLADGASGPIASPTANSRLNISGIAEPTNTFSLGGVTRYRNRGTASIEVLVPNPGELTISGTGIRTKSTTYGAPGGSQLLIATAARKRRKLNERGKVKVIPTFTYTPAGGDPRSQSRTVRLKKNLPPKKSR